MQVRLKVTSGANAGKEVLVPVSKFFIGRDPQCHLRPKSDAISRHHCALLITETQVAVRDFGSKNGTHINGERVQDICMIRPGDVLRVGPLEFQVNFQPPVTVKRPAVQSVKEVADRTAEPAAQMDDTSVADWIMEADEDAKDDETATVPETRMYRMDETERVALDTAAQDTAGEDTTSTQDTQAVEETQTGEDTEVKKRPKKKKPGKLPKQKTDASGDSRTAANDALRKYFNRS